VTSSRVVHAKGAGAFGKFEVTNEQIDITDYTDADFLKGGKTRLFARFSTIVGERGSADSVRDARGFAFKLYTKQGNLDWVFLSTASSWDILALLPWFTDVIPNSPHSPSGMAGSFPRSSTARRGTRRPG